MNRIKRYVNSDSFLSATLGWKSALFLAAYWSIPVLVGRFIFGSHALTQFGTEVAVFGAAMCAAYLVGFYQPFKSPFLTTAGLLPGFTGNLRLVAYDVIALFAVMCAVGMWYLGGSIAAQVTGAFTSGCWLFVYSAGVGIMGWFGVSDYFCRRAGEFHRELEAYGAA